jgi:hypothetical protein
MREHDWLVHDQLFLKMPGAADFVDWYGGVTAFHDGEIHRVEISCSRNVIIEIHFWRLHATTPDNRVLPPFEDRLVVLTLSDVAELELAQLYKQNVISALILKPASAPVAGQPIYGRDLSAEDIEVEIEPAVGIGGRIRCGSVSIALKEWSGG